MRHTTPAGHYSTNTFLILLILAHPFPQQFLIRVIPLFFHDEFRCLSAALVFEILKEIVTYLCSHLLHKVLGIKPAFEAYWIKLDANNALHSMGATYVLDMLLSSFVLISNFFKFHLLCSHSSQVWLSEA